jgi:hypothetical protein
MNVKKLEKSPLILILIIGLIFGKLKVNKHFNSDSDICFNICSDARGYYAWLPAIFIHQDLNFHFFDEIEVKGNTCGGIVGGCLQDYRYSFNGKMCNKYYPGASLMMIPFFAIAHIGTLLFSDFPANGYSPLYFKLIGLSGIFYYILGMFFVWKILKHFKLSIRQQLFSIIMLTLGSNIMYYSIDKPAYSHIFSFALISLFIYQAFLIKDQFSANRLILLSILFGWIFITRPVNISVAIILPFIFWNKNGEIFKDIVSSLKNIVALILGTLFLPIFLFSLYKISTDKWFLYSYDKEGFDFINPHFFDFLISYDNGILPYTPLIILPLIFLPINFTSDNKRLWFGVLVTTIATIYIHSSWWCWSYGFSFGARTMLDFLALFALGYALIIKQKSIASSILLPSISILCCILTMVLYHQKNHGFMNEYPIKDYWSALYNIFGII